MDLELRVLVEHRKNVDVAMEILRTLVRIIEPIFTIVPIIGFIKTECWRQVEAIFRGFLLNLTRVQVTRDAPVWSVVVEIT